MQLGRLARATSLCLVVPLWSCTGLPGEPIRTAPAPTRLPAPDTELPATSSDGTPYVFRNAVIGGGGFVSGVVFSPAKAGVVYARTDVGGAYRFDPIRKLWIPLTDMFGRA